MQNFPQDKESKAFRKTIYVGIIAYFIGFVMVFVAIGWVIVHFIVPESRWWNVLHAGINAILISGFGGLCSALVAVTVMNRYYYWRGIYRCPFCDRPLKDMSTLCDCPQAQALRRETTGECPQLNSNKIGEPKMTDEPIYSKDNLKEIILARKKAYNIKSFCWGIPGIIIQGVSFIFLNIRLNEILKTQTYNASDQMTVWLLNILLLLGSVAVLIGMLYYTKYLNRHWAWSLFAFVPFGIFVLAFLKDETERLYPAEVSVSEEMKNAKTSKLAITSLILGILGIVTIVPAIPGLICGILAIIKINKRPGSLKGRFLAIIGIVISTLICLAIFSVIFFSIMV